MKSSKTSAQKVGRFTVKDPYFVAAKKDGYAARSVYKLQEIDHDVGLIKKDNIVLDLGCAPGSWLQYVDNKIKQGKGRALGIDLTPVKLSFGPQVKTIEADIFEVSVDALAQELGMDTFDGFDVVLSDMAPSTTGIRSVDQDRSMALCEAALELAVKMLKPGGNFCVKVFEGGGMQQFVSQVKSVFAVVKIKRPKGIRTSSKEIYVVGLKKTK